MTAVSSVDSFRSACRYQKHEFADRVPVDGKITASGAGLSSYNIGLLQKVRQLSQEWIVLLVKIAVILQGVRLDHWRLSIALTLCQNKLRKPLAAADWCRRKTNGFGSGHNFLVKVIKDITPVEAFSKC